MERKTCPFLGLQEDPNTALDFPSEGNACHKASPVAPVEISHQQQYCLAPGYKACPIYKSVDTQPVPAMFAAPSFLKDQRKRRIALFAIPILAAAVVGLGIVINPFIGKFALLGASQIPQTGANQASSMGLFNIPPTSQPLVLPMANLTPTVKTNISCVHPDGWVPYVVAPTDSLFRLSAVYGVSVEALQQGNCMQDETVILPGNVIYVPFLPSVTPTLTSTATQVILPTNTRRPANTAPASNKQEDNPAPQPAATQVPPTAVPQVAPTSVPPTSPPPQPTAKPPDAKPPETKPPEQPKPPKDSKPPDNGGGGGDKGGKGGKGKGKGG